MAKFTVVAGRHVEGGVVYGAGQIVESARDLSKVFPGKFTPTTVKDEEKLRALGGGRPSVPAEAPIADPAPVAAIVPETSKTSAGRIEVSEGPVVSAPAPAEVPAPAGKDVTKQYPKAVDEDYRVFKMSDGYHVYDADDLSKPMNPKPLTKVEINPFIKAALKKG